MKINLDELSGLLLGVEKPSRYTGGEFEIGRAHV